MARPPVLGQQAPALAGVEWWLEPHPVDEPIRVVHFWTATSAAGRQATQHLSALQEEFGARGVQMIGLVADEAEREATAAWIARHSERIRHGVGWDPDGENRRRWLTDRAAADPGLVVVVDRAGRLAFLGHLRWLRAPLEGLAADDWDPERGAAAIALAAADFALIYRASGERPDRVVALCAEFRVDHPRLAEAVDELEFEALLALDRGRAAAAVGRRLVARAEARWDARALNEVAWALVDPMRRLGHRDLDLALRAAQGAVRWTEGHDAYALDTLARVHARRGDFVRAIELQRRALELSDEPLLRAALEEYLAELHGQR